jgi:hypothetical protein
MTVALRRPMTLPEFLGWEERQELRFEFDGVQPVGMTGDVAPALPDIGVELPLGDIYADTDLPPPAVDAAD